MWSERKKKQMGTLKFKEEGDKKWGHGKEGEKKKKWIKEENIFKRKVISVFIIY